MIFYDSLLNCLLDRKTRYISFARTIRSWYANRGRTYITLTFEEIRRRFKTSDTIFVLGSAESIREHGRSHWKHVGAHDSFAMNWWPLHDFVPTYYYTNYPRDPVYFERFRAILAPRYRRYSETVFFLSGDRSVRRGLHPRIVPDLFSETPNCCFYKMPVPLEVRKPDPFNRSHFQKTLYYRGGLSLVLDLVHRMGYRRIVLLGVDLNNLVHFYDDRSEITELYRLGYGRGRTRREKENLEHGTMLSKGNKYPMDEYLAAMNEIYFREKGISLFVGSSKSHLAAHIPVYPFS